MNEAEERVNPIILRDKDTGEEYTLEFSRDSVIFTNKQGFKPSEIDDNFEEMLPILWFGAFRMHHKNVSRARTDAILFNELHGVSDKMLERLVHLYRAPRRAMIRVEDDEDGASKNANTTMEVIL